MNRKKAELKDRLRDALALREKKAVDISRDLNIPKSAVSQYLSGKSQNMDSERLHSICKYLDISEPWLLGFDVAMERTITSSPTKAAEIHVEMIMDEDLSELFEYFKKLDKKQKKIVKDLCRSMAEAEA